MLHALEQATARRRAAQRGWQWGALAASVLLAFAAGWFGGRWTQRPAAPVSMAFAHDAALAHIVYSPEKRHPVEVSATEQQHLVAQAVEYGVRDEQFRNQRCPHKAQRQRLGDRAHRPRRRTVARQSPHRRGRPARTPVPPAPTRRHLTTDPWRRGDNSSQARSDPAVPDGTTSVLWTTQQPIADRTRDRLTATSSNSSRTCSFKCSRSQPPCHLGAC